MASWLADIVRGASTRAADARRDVRLAFVCAGAPAAERVARAVAGAPAELRYAGSVVFVYYVDGRRVLTKTVRNGRTEYETY